MTTGEDERHVGPYRLIEHLGRGGMGEVWLAEDVTGAAGGAPRRVALKLLDHRWLDDGEARARFAREVAAARLVRGPGVAALLDADVEAAQPWLASAYVAGPTLEEHVSRHGPLADGPLRALGAALADALVSIHAVGVVHRDLTPRNVVLGPDGPRVVDFGIAWYAEAAAITEAGARVGTPAWMPPERLSGDVVSPAGDVWSWGAVMAYAARGRPVVIGSSPEVVTDPGLQGEADLAGVPGWLESWVRAALSTDPAVRPASDALLAAMSAPRSSPAVAGPDAAAAPTAVEHALPTVAFDADPTRERGPGVAAGPPAPAGPAPPGASEAAAVTGAIGPRDAELRRRRTIRWVSAAVILVAAVAVGFFAGLLGAVIVTAVLVILAVALRLGRENQPSEVPPVPPTWAVALAVPVVLGTALMQAFGVVVGAAALLGLVVLFFVLGGDIA
jgi:eukaryotic-like serine/threonine-protein kinase